MKQPAVYIMASQRNGTLYTGVTSMLVDRTWQHREGLTEGFTKRYNCKMLVWYELTPRCLRRSLAKSRSKVDRVARSCD